MASDGSMKSDVNGYGRGQGGVMTTHESRG